MSFKRFIDVGGTGEEMAEQQGRHYAAQLPDMVSAVASLKAAFPEWVPMKLRKRAADVFLPMLGRAYLLQHDKQLRGFAGGAHRRGLAGLARGLGTTPEFVAGFWSLEIWSSKMGYACGCSAFAFDRDATAWQGTCLAYNHDFPPEFAPFSLLRRRTPAGGWASLSITYPTILGTLCGVNEAGLALTVNHAWVRRLPLATSAVLITSLAQEALDRCATVAEALALFARHRVPNGSIITLVDRHNARAALELAPTHKAVRQSTAPLLRTFNQYLVGTMLPLEVPQGAIGKGNVAGLDIHGPNRAREHRFTYLKAAQRTDWTLKDVIDLLTDHGDGKPSCNTICRHDDPLSETLLSAVIDPHHPSMRVCFGHPCEGKYEQFHVNPHAAVEPLARQA